jgi:uncharacterized membrane protein YfhO
MADPAAPPPAGEARIVAHVDERVQVEVRTDRPTLLVLTESWYPGWRAYVDGQERPIHRVDHVFRGVVLTPGDGSVVFEYRPASFRTGALASVAGVLLLGIATMGIGLSRRRKELE